MSTILMGNWNNENFCKYQSIHNFLKVPSGPCIASLLIKVTRGFFDKSATTCSSLSNQSRCWWNVAKNFSRIGKLFCNGLYSSVFEWFIQWILIISDSLPSSSVVVSNFPPYSLGKQSGEISSASSEGFLFHMIIYKYM